MYGENTVLWFAVFLALLQVKHFVIDFAYQGKYMTRRANKKGWLYPLIAHSGAHGIASLIVLIIPAIVVHQLSFVAVLCLAEAICHFSIDLVRSRLFHYNVFQPTYWTVHGFDQMMHSLTYVGMVTALCINSLV